MSDTKPDPIICPCGQPAKERVGGDVVYGMGSSQYFDDDGRLHHHELGRVPSYFRCKADHAFKIEGPGCWCGWPTDGETTKTIVPR